MALADIVVADATPTNVTFRYASGSAGKCIFSDGSRTILDPRFLTIAHQKVGKNEKTRVRTLIRLDDTQVDTDGVTADQASAYLVIDRPSRIVSSSDLNHLIALIKNLLTADNITKLLAGQQL